MTAVHHEGLAERVGRAAVLDVDYHHGNGTQQIFYQRSDVLYVSLHAGLGLPTLILQEGGYFVPKLGANARTWLRGLLGRPLDLRATLG